MIVNYVLDTDTISNIVWDSQKWKLIKEKISLIPTDNIFTTCISKAEIDRWFRKIEEIKSDKTKSKLVNAQALFRIIQILEIK